MDKMDPKTIYLKDYQPSAFVIDQVTLCFVIEPDHTRVQARLTVRQNPAGPVREQLVLQGEQMELVQVRLGEKDLVEGIDYQVDDKSLSILVSEQARNDGFTLETHVRIDPKTNTALEGLYVSNGMYCTQCEAEGFRRITYFLDRPDVMSRYEVRIEADKTAYPQLLSNGNLIERQDLPDGRHVCVWQDPFPKPCYLFALVAGRLSVTEDTFVTCSTRTITLQIYTEPKDADKVDHAMASLKAAMKWDEETYGLEYDLDLYMIVAVSHFNMGAMENKGLNIFNTSCVLASMDTSTDVEFQRVEGVIAHEYFHNYSGNRVTCRDWFQLSLKEGFTVFRDQTFSEDMGVAEVKRIEDVQQLRTFQFAEDASGLAHAVRPEHYIEINNFYTLTVYEKGAELVRMLRTLYGVQGFRQGTDLYFKRHDGQAVTTDDFVNAIVDANLDHPDAKKINSQQFKRWYSQVGTPGLVVTTEYVSGDELFKISVEQQYPRLNNQPAYTPFLIPLKISLLDADGRLLPLVLTDESGILGKPGETERVLLVSEPAQTFVFKNISEAPIPSLLRDFSAPIRLDYAYSDQALSFLFKQDTGFGQYEAAHTLFVRAIHAGVKAYQDAKPIQVPATLSEAFAATLPNAQISDSLKAVLLSMPSLLAISETFDQIDIDAIYAVCQGIREQLAQQFETELLTLYDHLDQANKPEISTQAIGIRALKNTCLNYLGSRHTTAVTERLETAYNQASTMTDRLAALRIMVHEGYDGAAAALENFYDRWQDEDLVIDHWFAVQVSSPHESALKQVQQLIEHQAFSWTNPNRVRAVVSRFAMVNLTQFHRKDGLGYQFLADAIIKLNEINPQIAARLLKPFASWPRYTPDRQQLMQGTLARVLQAPLSSDVYEMASKSLGTQG